MKIIIGLKVRYYLPKPAKKLPKFYDCIVRSITVDNIFLKIIGMKTKLIVPKNKQSLKQMRLLK
jgi:hypothetical protein